jgi:hypothetical protein
MRSCRTHEKKIEIFFLRKPVERHTLVMDEKSPKFLKRTLGISVISSQIYNLIKDSKNNFCW